MSNINDLIYIILEANKYQQMVAAGKVSPENQARFNTYQNVTKTIDPNNAQSNRYLQAQTLKRFDAAQKAQTANDINTKITQMNNYRAKIDNGTTLAQPTMNLKLVQPAPTISAQDALDKVTNPYQQSEITNSDIANTINQNRMNFQSKYPTQPITYQNTQATGKVDPGQVDNFYDNFTKAVDQSPNINDKVPIAMQNNPNSDSNWGKRILNDIKYGSNVLVNNPLTRGAGRALGTTGQIVGGAGMGLGALIAALLPGRLGRLGLIPGLLGAGVYGGGSSVNNKIDNLRQNAINRNIEYTKQQQLLNLTPQTQQQQTV